MKKFLVVALGVLSVNAFADDLKFAYVNFEKIMKDSAVAIAVDSNYKTKFTPENDKLQSLNQKIVSEYEEFKATKDKKKADTLKLKIEKEQAQLQSGYMAFQQTLNQTQQISLAVLSSKVNEIVKDLSSKDDFDVVLSYNQLVFAKNKFDITDEVLAKLEKVNSADMISQIDAKVSQANQAPSSSPVVAK